MSQNNTPSTGANQGNMLFGSASSTTSPFGQSSSQTSSTLFSGGSGGAAKQQTAFGGGNTSGGFGGLGQASSGSVFASGMTTTPSSATGFSFGQRSADSQGSGTVNFMGGASTPNRTGSGSGGQQATGNTLFGGNTNTSNEQPSNSGAATPNTTKTTPFFGSTTPAGPPPASSSSGVFGNLSQSTGFLGNSSSKPENASGNLSKINTQQQSSSGTASPSIFTQNNSTNTGSQSHQPSLFSSAGGQPASNMFGGQSQTSGSSLFGYVQKPSQSGSQQAEKQQSSQSQDGTSQETIKPSAPSFFASQTTSAPPPSNPTTSTATTGPEKSSLFTNNSSPAGQNTGFFTNLSKKKDDSVSSNKQQEAQVTSSTSTATTTTTAPTSTSLFGSNAPTAAAGSSSTQGTQATTSAGQPSLTVDSSARQDLTSSTTLSSSMVGPSPNTQSRLKNKSMDEIITRWASDLSKYQKEFQAQADKVAKWDQTLLQNANEIAELYSRTFHAERDTAEVQKQLSIVEGHQEELSQWLDRYEGEVDAMMARQMGQGETFQGPDQERERTYKTAERVSEHLDEMGKELTTMIEEVNDASALISKTSRPDDPLSQIVKILNSHLSQLQVIDQGTAALENRIKAAQRDRQRLSMGTRGGARGDDADAFYRSYMNRG